MNFRSIDENYSGTVTQRLGQKSPRGATGGHLLLKSNINWDYSSKFTDKQILLLCVKVLGAHNVQLHPVVQLLVELWPRSYELINTTFVDP